MHSNVQCMSSYLEITNPLNLFLKFKIQEEKRHMMTEIIVELISYQTN